MNHVCLVDVGEDVNNLQTVIQKEKVHRQLESVCAEVCMSVCVSVCVRVDLSNILEEAASEMGPKNSADLGAEDVLVL